MQNVRYFSYVSNTSLTKLSLREILLSAAIIFWVFTINIHLVSCVYHAFMEIHASKNYINTLNDLIGYLLCSVFS